jgi:hypothetical protein
MITAIDGKDGMLFPYSNHYHIGTMQNRGELSYSRKTNLQRTRKKDQPFSSPEVTGYVKDPDKD